MTPRTWLVAAIGLAMVVTADGPAITGLDHIPIAVNDLERAAADYQKLGFSLKPGRPHDNGIRNQHVKFPDGTELELITAPAARDPLTTTYRRHLAQGDGPAFLAFFAPDRDATPATMPSYIFLGPRNQSPTDRPEHFAHANTAESFISVWIAGKNLDGERDLLQRGGARFTRLIVSVPEATPTLVAQLDEGTVVFLPESRQVVRGRPIVGATLRVRDLAVARRIIETRNPSAKLIAADSSLFLPPAVTHGLWIELRSDNLQKGK